jgi:lysozyme family protein
MADAYKVIPFIKSWEGGLSKAKTDTASKDPLPDGSGYHTNKGITWSTWKHEFGSGSQSIKDFYAMPDNLWNRIYIKYYWSAIKGNEIKSQRIADLLANWTWASGSYTPIKKLQLILGKTADGIIGNETLNALNSANEESVYNKLKAANYSFFENLVKNPIYAPNKAGWFNRLNDFYSNYLKDAIKKNYKPLLVISLIGFSIILAKKYKLL